MLLDQIDAEDPFTHQLFAHKHKPASRCYFLLPLTKCADQMEETRLIQQGPGHGGVFCEQATRTAKHKISQETPNALSTWLAEESFRDLVLASIRVKWWPCKLTFSFSSHFQLCQPLNQCPPGGEQESISGWLELISRDICCCYCIFCNSWDLSQNIVTFPQSSRFLIRRCCAGDWITAIPSTTTPPHHHHQQRYHPMMSLCLGCGGSGH